MNPSFQKVFKFMIYLQCICTSENFDFIAATYL